MPKADVDGLIATLTAKGARDRQQNQQEQLQAEAHAGLLPVWMKSPKRVADPRTTILELHLGRSEEDPLTSQSGLGARVAQTG